MSEPSIHEGDREAPGAVQQLARDDVARKRFLTMTGKRMGAGAAATALGAFIAACGSSSSSSSSATAAGATSSSSSAATTMSSSSAATSSPDLAIVNYALTPEYLESQSYANVIKSGLFHGKNLSVIKSFGSRPSRAPSRTSVQPPTWVRRATSRARRSSPPHCRSTASRHVTRPRSTSSWARARRPTGRSPSR